MTFDMELLAASRATIDVVRIDDLYVEDAIPGLDGLPTRSVNTAIFSALSGPTRKYMGVI